MNFAKIIFSLFLVCLVMMSLAQGPGGVNTDLQLWLKANVEAFRDAGFNLAVDGQGVQEWHDQFGVNDASQLTVGSQPIFRNTSDNINFNAILDFDGSGDHLAGSAGAYSGTYYIVFRNDLIIDNSSTASSFVFGMTPDATITDDFGGFAVGSFEGDITDEVFGHAADQFQSAYTSNSISYPVGSTFLITVREDLFASGTEIYLAGEQLNNASAGIYESIGNGAYVVGDESSGGSFLANSFDGQIAEIITFSSRNDDAEVERIQSYLALKYGITLQVASFIYVASDGITGFWNSGANSSFNNDVFGVGRDDNSGLGQVLSKSVNSDAVVTLLLEGESSDDSNSPSNLTYMDVTDREFLMIGNNDGTATWTSTGAPSRFQILTREWFVEETGDVGTVQLDFDVADSDFDVPDLLASDSYYLVVDSDADGDFSDETPTVLSDEGGNIWRATGIDFDNGEKFTLAKGNAPGGVSADLSLWLRADEDVFNDAGVSFAADGESVQQWNDLSSGNNATQTTGTNQPVFRDNETDNINFNPVLEFNGGTGGTGSFMTGSAGASTLSYYLVFRNDLTITNNIVAESFVFGITPDAPISNDFGGFGIANITGGLTDEIFTNAADNWRSGYTSTTESIGPNTTFLIGVRENSLADGTDIYWDGLQVNNATGVNPYESINNRPYAIGDESPTGGFQDATFNGEIAEVISFNSRVSDTEHLQIQSYLAAKYGIALDQSIATSYLASDGTTNMWNSAAPDASTYNNDIAVVGRDDDSGLSQTKSRSLNLDDIIEIELIGEAEGSYTDLDNLEFLSWGNDNDDDGFVEPITTGTPPGVDNILDRTWKVQEVGEPGNISLSVDLNGVSNPTGSVYYLITDTDTDFTDASTLLENTITNGIVTFNISEDVLEDGTFFTFGFTGGAGPGAVAVDLNIWLKADSEVFNDAGLSTAEDGDLVQQWNDQAFGFDASQTSVASRPRYRDNDADNINFNPVLSFDGSDDFMDGSEGFYTDNYYVVFELGEAITTGTSPGRIVFSFDCIGCTTFDFANLGLGANSGSINNEVITHSSDNWRVYQTASSYSSGDVFLIGYNESGGSATMTINGETINLTSASLVNQSNVAYRIGETLGAFAREELNGKFAEFISYSSEFSGSESQRIESYLAIKYGVSLDQTSPQDYLASDNSTIIWNSTTASGYPNNITVIGQDSGSELLQIKSKSQASGGVVTIEARDEAEGSLVDLEDIEFLSWSNNGIAGTTDTGVPTGVTQMLQKIWFVQETGDDSNEVGDLNVTFDITGLGLSAGDYYLIYDQVDTDFSDATTIVATSSDGSTVTFNALNEDVMESGTYFTLGVFVTTPGGASTGISAWFDANQGVTQTSGDVSEWSDISGNGNNATQATAANQPDLIADFLNFNNVIDFDGDILDPVDGDFLDGVNGGAYSDAYYIVFQNDLIFDNTGDPGSGTFPLGMTPGVGTEVYGGLGLNGSINSSLSLEAISHGVSDLYAVGQTSGSLITYTAGTTFLLAVRDNDSSTPTASEIYLYGTRIDNATAGTFTSISDQNFRIGEEASGGTVSDQAFDGKIAEIIMFSAGTTTAEHAQIQSYLALKYGITLDQTSGQDYVASDGSTEMWDKDATDASTYDNDIFGIGLDQASGLDQPKSRSINDDGVITIANNDFDAPSSISTDLTFLSIGNDDALLTETTSDVPANVTDRIAREWKAQVVGDVLTIDMEVDVSSSGLTGKTLADFILIVDKASGIGTIGDFSDGTIETFLPSTFESDLVRFEGVSLEDGDVFSLGTGRSITVAPGGVATNLNLWLKADAGVSLSGVNVVGWEDQTSNNVDLIQGTTTNQPRFSASFMNGNPAIRFNNDAGVDDLLANSAVTTFPTTALTNFIVINREEDLTDRNEGLIDFYTVSDADEYLIRDLNVDMSVHFNTNSRSSSPDTDFDDGISHIVGVQWEGTGGTSSFYKDGLSLGITSNYPSGVTLSASGQLALGNQSNDNGGSPDYFTTDDAFIGAISEVVLYSSELVASDQDRVNSYLAIKYGITLDLSGGDDYLASTAGVIWDNTNGGGSYNNEIIGIGRDDASALNQLISSNSADILTLSVPSISTDLNFLLVGNDGGVISNTNDTDLPLGVEGRLNRVWFADETGSIEGSLTFDLSEFDNTREEDLVLLLDDDGDFSNASQHVVGKTLSVSDLSFSIPDFSSTPYFTVGTTNETETPLPVELLSFTGIRDNNGVRLNWVTASESNNSHFEIERSMDAFNWSHLGEVTGSGSSNIQVGYKFVDRSPMVSSSYYRLKQVDFDGSYEYSGVVFIKAAESELSTVEVYPNPTTGVLNFQTNDYHNKVYIYDTAGKIRSYSRTEGRNFSIDIADYPEGVYFILIESEGGRSIRRILKN